MTHPNCHIQLDDLLSVLGIAHQPSKIEGKRDWLDANRECIGTYDAAEGWAILKAAPLMFRALKDYTDWTADVTEGEPELRILRRQMRNAVAQAQNKP